MGKGLEVPSANMVGLTDYVIEFLGADRKPKERCTIVMQFIKHDTMNKLMYFKPARCGIKCGKDSLLLDPANTAIKYYAHAK